jgi:DNA-binding GntR family transcriptional regulator
MPPPNLKDVAERYISEGIVSGRLRPGTKVDQDEIAAVLGISRLPVREALIELAQKGFVVSIPRRGSYVTRLEAVDVEDHYEVLAMAFSLVSRRAAAHISDERLDELDTIHATIAATESADDVAFLNRDFHLIINNEGSSRRLLSVLGFLGGALPAWLYHTSPSYLEIEREYRGQMLAALRAHDEDEAASVTIEHLRACARSTVQTLTERGYWDDAADIPLQEPAATH